MSSSLILPLLPLRDIVVFPESLQVLFVGRPRSVAALRAAQRATGNAAGRIVLAAQRTAKAEEPGPDDILSVSAIGVVRTLVPLQNSMMKVLVAGEERARIKRFLTAAEAGVAVEPDGDGVEPYYVELERLADLEVQPSAEVIDGLMPRLMASFEEFARLSKRVQGDTPRDVAEITHFGRRADVIAGYVSLKPQDKQALLEQMDVEARVRKLIELLEAENEMARMQRKVRGRFNKRPETPRDGQAQPPAQQPPAPPSSDDMQDEFKNELNDLEGRLAKKNLTQEARERVARELKKLRMMSGMSAEATVVRGYLEWVAALPWKTYSEDPIDIATAEEILDEDHFGLEKVKERVLEHLAVQKLVDRLKGPILCLVGPPGVGKTSLAKSIARATGREFVRLSLGGVRDEAEIRGHRRTYIGALPGKLIASLKRAGTSNPVLLLDEIDKMSTDFRGDPAAALLEVLDPEQNHSFVDHYLDLDYDLSKILFLCTANSLSGISGPLQDRLEIIRLSGYTDLEKQAIARQYLIPKLLEANGLATFAPLGEPGAGVDEDGKPTHTRQQLGGAKVVVDDGAIKKIIHGYTRESGVRNLEREIGTVARKTAIELLKRVGEGKATSDVAAAGTGKTDKGEKTDKVVVAGAGAAACNGAAAEEAETDEGPAVEAEADSRAAVDEDPKKAALRARLQGQELRVTAAKVREFLGTERFQRHDKDSVDQIGVTNGLAWTAVGGEMLMTEVSVMPGRGKLVSTGKLGDVMQESAQAAMSYVRSRAKQLGLSQDFYERIDVHIHVPEGATPKDGPSAGITIATSLVSSVTRIPVRHDIAMTGEITLRGRVMAIGGLKEKALAAHRAGCKTVIIPADNKKDVADIPETVRKKLKFVPVETVDEVLKVALAVDDPDAFFARLSQSPGSDVFDESAFKRRKTDRKGDEEEAAKVH
ncbi:MAG: AAA family ATPase [Deltaproteobacteria bacterium]|nr:AAA family ATPase [Deltaproteobacteria bacterium]